MSEAVLYDSAIIGGGLAGLGLSIQLAKKGYKVILFEKETYPFHKVCGEYISMESWPFLQSLGVPLPDMQLPLIKKLIVTAPDGNLLQEDLPLGGFGISRYTLDALLKDIAITHGVTVKENCKVADVHFADEQFTIHTNGGIFKSIVCCGSFGKKSNLDVKWKRTFTQFNSRKLNMFTGIKYHIETDFAADTIALHNFRNGYCGISKIEGNRYCFCYLTHTDNLKESGQSVEKMETEILSLNPHLKKILTNSKKIYSAPVSISQISFLQKTQIENHVLMLGDAAGLITPLCGNGMSMALHASKIAAGHVALFLDKKTTRAEMEAAYMKEWKAHFAKRLSYGRIIQFFFGKNWTTNLFIRFMKNTPSFTRWLIKQTHGKPF
ncbi:MAG TPA: lycopene cyclase family protein [Ferruginibacter sp.]|nr:lycopene cyclase family protein [Ferruginibacter sp.]